MKKDCYICERTARTEFSHPWCSIRNRAI